MDEYTETCISLGAAAAATCVPCFQHYFSKAESLGITTGDIEKAVEIAVKVRGGAHMAMKDSIQKILGKTKAQKGACCYGPAKCCD